MNETNKPCACKICQGYCLYKPGWFAPGEAEKVADYLNISLQELFETKLVADYWDNPDGTRTYNLSPASEDNTPGEVDDRIFPTGTCVFFIDGLCSIHAVKPMECRLARHDRKGDGGDIHRQVALLWDTEEAQAQVHKLLAIAEENT